MTVLKVMLSFQMLSFGLILIVILLIKWWRQKPLRDFTSKVPGLNKLPFIGSAYKLIGVAPEDIYETIAGWTKIYKSDFTYWLGSYMVLHIFDPKDIKTVLNSQSCNDKPEIFYHSYFKHGLFLENGEKHRLQRKTVNPAFNPTALRFYNPIVEMQLRKVQVRNCNGKKIFDFQRAGFQREEKIERKGARIHSSLYFRV